MLHITNGDHAGDMLKAAGIGGDVLPWRDPMHHGPFPANLDLDAVSEIRARYLVGSDANDGFRPRNRRLRDAMGREDIVLWFEHDLLDQLQILQIMDILAEAAVDPARVSLICIDRHPGIEPFRGLGQLTAPQLAALFPSRRTISRAHYEVARAAWAAFRAPDPNDLLAFARGKLDALPFLRAALFRHFEEFPAPTDGLTRSERQILTIVAEGTSAPLRIFAANMARETALFEGDLRTWQHIASLCAPPHPLLHCDPDGVFTMPPDAAFRAQRLKLTTAGAQRLTARGLPAAEWPDRDMWLGGVQLRGHKLWTWDAAAERFGLI
jgi:hypothetical protein